MEVRQLILYQKVQQVQTEHDAVVGRALAVSAGVEGADGGYIALESLLVLAENAQEHTLLVHLQSQLALRVCRGRVRVQRRQRLPAD